MKGYYKRRVLEQMSIVKNYIYRLGGMHSHFGEVMYNPANGERTWAAKSSNGNCRKKSASSSNVRATYALQEVSTR